MASTESNRRVMPRYPVDLPAQLRAGPSSQPGRVRVLSRLAALVETPLGLDPGAFADLAIETPGAAGPIEVLGQVIRVTRSAESSGMVLMFRQPPSSVQARIDALLARQGS